MAVLPAVERPVLLDDLPRPEPKEVFEDDDGAAELVSELLTSLGVTGDGVLIFVTTTVDGCAGAPSDGVAITVDVTSCVVAGAAEAVTMEVTGCVGVGVGVVVGVVGVGVVNGVDVVKGVVVVNGVVVKDVLSATSEDDMIRI